VTWSCKHPVPTTAKGIQISVSNSVGWGRRRVVGLPGSEAGLLRLGSVPGSVIVFKFSLLLLLSSPTASFTTKICPSHSLKVWQHLLHGGLEAILQPTKVPQPVHILRLRILHVLSGPQIHRFHIVRSLRGGGGMGGLGGVALKNGEKEQTRKSMIFTIKVSSRGSALIRT